MSPRTLLLTESMQPHKVVPWEEAVTMMFNGKVRVIETYDDIIGRVRFDQMEDFEHFLEDLPASAYDGDMIVLRTPSVMALKKEIGSIKRGVKFSRINVLTRDKYRCAYCAVRGTDEDLNYDHVIPRSQGGRTVWENIVASCYPCNSKKANRTPEQAGMRLLTRPYKPKTLPMTSPVIRRDQIHPDWHPYLRAVA